MIHRQLALIPLALCLTTATASAASSSPSPSPTPPPGPSGLDVPGYDPKPAKAEKSLKIFILGGTGFTGPYQVKYAVARGHSVTVFNRRKTHPGILPDGVEQLTGDRNTGDLASLKGRKWDVVLDNPIMLPKWVHDAGEILQGQTALYIFISTISVYANGRKPNADETAPLAKYEGKDSMKETRDTVIASQFALYGPLKAGAGR